MQKFIKGEERFASQKHDTKSGLGHGQKIFLNLYFKIRVSHYAF